MAIDQKKIISWAFFVLIVLVVVVLMVKNWNWIKGTFHIKGKGCKETDTPFDCVKKMGAVKSDISGVGDRYDYPADPNEKYGFYSNGRAVRFLDGKRGDYDKETIKWDGGTQTSLKEIFKK